MRQWNVRVMRDGHAIHIGQVAESCEALARCAALSLFGIGEEETEAEEGGRRRAVIYPDEDFAVSPVLQPREEGVSGFESTAQSRFRSRPR